MADGRKEGTAFLLAGPAGEGKVDGEGAVSGGLGLPAEFEHAARAFE